MAAEQHSSEGGAPEYMVSYADMLTIMLAFFVVLYATTGTTSSGSSKGEKSGKAEASKKTSGAKEGLGPKEGGGGKEGFGGSQRDGAGGDPKAKFTEGGESPEARMEKIFRSLNLRFGPEWTLGNCWIGGPPELRDAPPPALSRGSAAKRNKKDVWGKAGNDDIRARSAKLGDQIFVGGRIYFDEFSAELTDPQKQKLRKAAEEIAGKMQRLEIRGHTSRRPLPKDSPYRDHWDLAYDRSRKVRDFLVAQGIDPQRIRLGVAAQNEPLDVEGDPLPVRQNSRVEIHVLNEYLRPLDNRRPESPRAESKPVAHRSSGSPATGSATKGAVGR